MEDEDIEAMKDSNTKLEIALYAMIPGLIIGIMIRMCTKVSQPPDILMTVYAILAFIMSIMWI